MSTARLPGPDWRVEGRDWPHRERSRFVERHGIRWHVQLAGDGPAILLLHGTGASGHSFRDLVAPLAERFTVIVPDLPGHAFTTVTRRFRPSLPGMAHALAELLEALSLAPEVVVGHSAGAAVLARMMLDHAIAPRLLVGLAAALVPFRGAATSLMSPAARLLGSSTSAARLIALQAGAPATVERMLRSTGSALDRRGVELYRRLASSPGHVAAVLSMLAAWDLHALHARLDRLPARVLLLAGERDRAVPLAQQREVASRIPGARVLVMHHVGHLLHEERPDTVARLILEEAAASPPTPGAVPPKHDGAHPPHRTG